MIIIKHKEIKLKKKESEKEHRRREEAGQAFTPAVLPPPRSRQLVRFPINRGERLMIQARSQKKTLIATLSHIIIRISLSHS